MKSKLWSSPHGELVAFTANHAKFNTPPIAAKVKTTLRIELPWKNGKPCLKTTKNKMNDAIQLALFEDFKDLFFTSDGNGGTVRNIGDIACGDGWEQIIRLVCEHLGGEQSFIAEVKEPFWGAYKLDVMLHNMARRVERLFGIPSYALYSQKLNRRYAHFNGFKTKIVRIKEKFGVLRVQYKVVDCFKPSDVTMFNSRTIDIERSKYLGWVAGVVDYAEALSKKTCENDGSPGELHSCTSWKTLCYECASKAEKF
jgi:hypothetical protein